jgi:hypothetical protein
MRIEQNASDRNTATEPEKPVRAKKRKRKMLVWIVVLVLFLGIPIVLLGASGIYSIPVISTVFGTSKPIDLGVRPNNEALQSGLSKFPVEFKGDPNSFSGIGNKELKGKTKVDAEYTSEEITSILDNFLQNAPHVKNIQVKYVEGGMEISAFVKTYIKAPTYAKIAVTRISSKSVDIDIQKIKIGRLPVPERYFAQIEKGAEDILNSRFAKLESFSMDKLEYHDGYSYLSGTVPASIQMLPGEQELF